MIIDGIELVDGSDIENLIVESGATLPASGVSGQLFYLTAVEGGNQPGLYTHVSGIWVSGDIQAVTAGSGLVGGGAQGAVTLAVDSTDSYTLSDSAKVASAKAVKDAHDAAVALANSKIDSVGVGSGLVGGGSSGDVTLDVNYSQVASVNYVDTEVGNISAGVDAMFQKTGSDITFYGNLIPSSDEAWSIGSAANKIKDLYVSANTVYLGDSTQVSGTSVVIDAGASPESISESPTLQASRVVAVPFTYTPNGGSAVTVRPSIEFQDDLGTAYPISFNTATKEFSFDEAGNHGTGSVVAKAVTLSNAGNSAINVTSGNVSVQSGTLAVSGPVDFNNNLTVDQELRVDGNVYLGYSSANVINVRGTLDIDTAITFTEGATLGDGNDDIVINAGLANSYQVTSQNYSVDAFGNMTIAGTINGENLSDKANTSAVYTKAETDNRIQAVVDAAPAALDTLNEIATALNNDPDFAATITNELTLKADKATTYTKTEVDTSLGLKADKTTTYTKTEVNTSLSAKVDKVSGKALSTNDFTNSLKSKLDGIATGAEVNRPISDSVSSTSSTSSASSAAVKTAHDAAVAASAAASTAQAAAINVEYAAFSATANQTLFNLSFTNVVGSHRMMVFVNGVKQAESAYTETSSSFTLSTGVPAGTVVEAYFR